ncbi:MAG: rhomboid family intramembrane serine protease, partial [Planctomycetes bacterium]|nr:rhomboid family intramembrane serine protease [Planctomycetota bacterium]
RGFFARWKLKRQRRLAEKSEQREERDRERLDALLEKIHLEGMGSLSSSERRFLESASKKLRKTP